MKNWRTELTESEKTQVEVKIQSPSSQGDSLSPLLFVLTMKPLNYALKKSTGG